MQFMRLARVWVCCLFYGVGESRDWSSSKCLRMGWGGSVTRADAHATKRGLAPVSDSRKQQVGPSPVANVLLRRFESIECDYRYDFNDLAIAEVSLCLSHVIVSYRIRL